MSVERINQQRKVRYEEGQRVLWRPSSGRSGAEVRAAREGRTVPESIIALAEVKQDGIAGGRIRIKVIQPGELAVGNKQIVPGFVTTVDRKDVCRWDEPQEVEVSDVDDLPEPEEVE